jgi:hypothetical protein
MRSESFAPWICCWISSPKCCQILGCNDIPLVKHHFVGTTLIANCSCQSGHIFRFCSSREVNSMYVKNIQMAAAVLLSGGN